MVQIFGLFMSDLLKDTHNELKLVLEDNYWLGSIRLLPLRFCTSCGCACAASRHSTLGTGAFTTGFFVVLVEPVLISLVHEAASKAIHDGLFDGQG
jgi:hypothetical protein